MLVAPKGVKLAGLGQRLGARILDALLVFLTLFIGYLIWWLIVLGRGQTPGKQLVGIRIWDARGTPTGWGRSFLREFVARLVTGIATGWFFWIDTLWALWDRDRQTLYDKIAGTVVVDDRGHR
jgi:uncharacterized RDD family membrane protein YckC